MSQEPHHETDRTRAGVDSRPGPGADIELERQRADGDLPGHQTRSQFREPADDEADRERDGEDQEEEEKPSIASPEGGS